MEPDHLTPKQIKRLREALCRTQVGMASIVGVSGRTWDRWESETSGSVPLPEFRRKLLKLWRFAGLDKEGGKP